MLEKVASKHALGVTTIPILIPHIAASRHNQVDPNITVHTTDYHKFMSKSNPTIQYNLINDGS